MKVKSVFNISLCMLLMLLPIVQAQADISNSAKLIPDEMYKATKILIIDGMHDAGGRYKWTSDAADIETVKQFLGEVNPQKAKYFGVNTVLPEAQMAFVFEGAGYILLGRISYAPPASPIYINVNGKLYELDQPELLESAQKLYKQCHSKEEKNVYYDWTTGVSLNPEDEPKTIVLSDGSGYVSNDPGLSLLMFTQCILDSKSVDFRAYPEKGYLLYKVVKNTRDRTKIANLIASLEVVARIQDNVKLQPPGWNPVEVGIVAGNLVCHFQKSYCGRTYVTIRDINAPVTDNGSQYLVIPGDIKAQLKSLYKKIRVKEILPPGVTPA